MNIHCRHAWIRVPSKVEEKPGMQTRVAVWEECEMCNRRRLSRIPPSQLEREESRELGSLFD